jgi:hypothetical protein
VAQIEGRADDHALATTKYVTRATLRHHGGLWFNDELFVIARGLRTVAARVTPFRRGS